MRLEDHNNQWRYNEESILWLQSCNCTYNDWLIVIAFYTALHKMLALLHHKVPKYDKKPETRRDTGHVYLNKMVKKHYKDVYGAYYTLYSKSRKLRYEQNRLNRINNNELKKYLDIWFKTIKPLKPFPTS